MSLEGCKKLLTMVACEGLEDRIQGRQISHIFLVNCFFFCPFSNLPEFVYTYSSESFVCIFYGFPLFLFPHVLNSYFSRALHRFWWPLWL